MYDQPDEWYTAICGSHTMVETVEVLDFDDTVLRTLDITSGDVTEDAGAAVRTSASCEAVDATGDLAPIELDDLLMPTGRRRVRISRGIVDAAGDMVPLATGFITQTRARRDADGRATVPLTILDRSGARLQRATSRPLAVPAGLSYPPAIRDVLLTVDPSATFDLMTSEATTPRLLFEAEKDLWAEARKMARALGGEIFIDRTDTGILKPVPLVTAATPAVWRFSEEVDPPERTSAVLSAETVAATDGIYNGVIVIGQHSSLTSPVRGEAWDERPTSPTYRYGDGENPKWVRTEKVTTDAQAAEMARAILQSINTATEVDVEVFPPPYHLVAGDIVEAEFPSVGVSGRYIYWRSVTPLADPAGPARITLRRSILEED